MRLSWRSQRLVLEAVLTLLAVTLLIRVIPVSRVITRLDSRHLPVADPMRFAEIVKFVDKTADRLPLKILCLPRAVTAKSMLRRRGFSSVLYLGARKDQGCLSYHAWLTMTDSPNGGSISENQQWVVLNYYC